MPHRITILTARPARLAAHEFAIAGILDDGTAVTARYEHGLLRCDDALERCAQRLVSAGATFELPATGRSHQATLSGDPVAIALTLIRAMRVVDFEINLDGATIKRADAIDR